MDPKELLEIIKAFFDAIVSIFNALTGKKKDEGEETPVE